MKFSINKSEFLNALNVVAKGASSRSTLPVLAGVKITARSASLVLETTDLDRSIRCVVAALVEDEGMCVIPQKLLSDIVKNLPDAAITVDVDDSEATVSCDKTSFTLHTLIPDDFPSFPEVNIDNQITVPFKQFSSAVKKVAKAASKDQSRAVLTGVLLRTTPEGMSIVATDSYRLAVCNLKFDSAGEEFEALVTSSFVLEVASLPEVQKTIDICLSANQVMFRFGDTVMVNRRIEGKYPAYEKLIAGSYTTKTCYTTSALITAVKRVGLMSSAASPIKFDINEATKNTVLSTNSQEIGTASEVVSCEVNGENVEIALNHQYIIDGLSSISTDHVFFETQGSMKPGVFRSGEGEDFLYLLMPVRLA
ncbi:DNA polymerase III subunit beta [Slackia heliotrinireducens]|uniref:DNA polymerase III subunit beta n=1 Tax=Slackia heliotrinireducens TaxID=84110 RepID=UPI003315E921